MVTVPILCVPILWVSAFAVNYWVFLRPLVASKGLQEYWAGAGAGGYPPMSWGIGKWLGGAFLELFAGYATMWLKFYRGGIYPALAAMGLSIAGFVSLWRRNRRALVLIALPVALTLMAAGMRKYPFADRLILFLVPLIVLTVAEGGWFLLNAGGRGRLGSALLLGMVLLPTIGRAMVFLIHPPGREEIKPVLAHLGPRMREGDTLYIYHGAEAAFSYYRDECGMPHAPYVVLSRPGDVRMTGRRAWVLFSHVQLTADGDEQSALVRSLDARGRCVESYNATGAGVFCYELGMQ
jgi:hypothetical protein